MDQAFNTLSSLIISSKYKVIAKDVETAMVSVEGTRFAQAHANRLDSLPPNYDGFTAQSSFSSISETLLKQLVSNGDTGAELILDDGFMPTEIRPFSTNTLKYIQKGKRYYPQITVDSEKIDLDYPTVEIVSLNQDVNTPYATSFYQSAYAATMAAEEYRNDSRRSFRRASIPRLLASIDQDKFIESLPIETRFDPKALAAAMSTVMSDVKDELTGLEPEDAVTVFDAVDVSIMTAGNISSHDALKEHAKIVNGNQASGLKTLPSILGRGESQSTASTETVLFLKIAESIQGRVNEIFSNLLTTAARLQGFDVSVSFVYDKPTLRTESESESFAVMKQSRIMELLSYGFIPDEEAAIELTGKLPPNGFEPLSGTRFKDQSTTEIENPYSNTSVSGKGITATKTQKDSSSNTEDTKTNQTTG